MTGLSQAAEVDNDAEFSRTAKYHQSAGAMTAILVTGSAGFIGFRLCKCLSALQAGKVQARMINLTEGMDGLVEGHDDRRTGLCWPEHGHNRYGFPRFAV